MKTDREGCEVVCRFEGKRTLEEILTEMLVESAEKRYEETDGKILTREREPE